MIASEALRCAPVLQRMIEILGAKENGRMTIGAAFDRAKSELQIDVPKAYEDAIMVSAFKIISQKRIPGAPDA